MGKETREVKKYPKKTFVKSSKYARYGYILQVLLEDGKKYSIDEVDKILNDYLNTEVK